MAAERRWHARWAPVACLIGLAIAVFVLYRWQLDRAPVYLAHDEVFFGLQAQSVSLSGSDLNGRFLPLFFSDRTYEPGREPISIYLTALMLKMSPLSEQAIRLPTVLVGLVDVVLMFFVARRLFHSDLMALCASAFLALSPAHFFYSRLAVDVIYPLPFVLGWLWLLLRFVEHTTDRLLFASTFVLGLGVYGYASAEVTAPALLLVTCAAATVNRKGSRGRACGVAVAGFIVALLPFLVWHAMHPDRYRGVIKAYGVYDPKLNVLQGLKDVATYSAIGDRVGAYWASLGPGFLFFFGDPSVADSTRHGGLFLLPMAALIAVGLYSLVGHLRSAANWVIVAGFLIAPLASMVNPMLTTRRVLIIVPFGVLIAMDGWRYLASRSKFGVYVIGLIGVLSLYQFAGFYSDYLTDYRLRSSGWFEWNIRGALEQLIALDDERGAKDRIYVNAENPFMPEYLQFYAAKHSHPAFLSRVIVNREVAPDSSGGVILVRQLVHARPDTACAAPVPLRLIATIREPDDTPSFVICTN